jgi:hypothetical protein
VSPNHQARFNSGADREARNGPRSRGYQAEMRSRSGSRIKVVLSYVVCAVGVLIGLAALLVLVALIGAALGLWAFTDGQV